MESVEIAREITRAKLPNRFINAYELAFPSRRPWNVSLYCVTPAEGDSNGHEDRGSIKNAVWEYRKANKFRCPGPQYFVIDVDASTVAIPTRWNIPVGTEFGGYCFAPIGDIAVDLDNTEHDP